MPGQRWENLAYLRTELTRRDQKAGFSKRVEKQGAKTCQPDEIQEVRMFLPNTFTSLEQLKYLLQSCLHSTPTTTHQPVEYKEKVFAKKVKIPLA